MTKKDTPDAGQIDWKEAFLFFYWDVKKHRGGRFKEGYITDRLVVEFFTQSRPPMASSAGDSVPRSWDWTLYRLMRALRLQLGFDTAPETTADGYDWLGSGRGPRDTEPPFVDWVRLETQTHVMFTYANNTVDRFLTHLAVDVYGPLSQKPDWRFSNSHAINPFLLEFQKAHGVKQWGVPIPIPAATEGLEGISWPETPVLASKAGLAHYPGDPIRFGISLESLDGISKATLEVPSDGVMNIRLLNLSKRYYVAMLRWVGAMRQTGKFTSLSDLLSAQFREWSISAGDGHDEETLVVARNMWEAYRSVGLQPIELKPPGEDKATKSHQNGMRNGGYYVERPSMSSSFAS